MLWLKKSGGLSILKLATNEDQSRYLHVINLPCTASFRYRWANCHKLATCEQSSIQYAILKQCGLACVLCIYTKHPVNHLINYLIVFLSARIETNTLSKDVSFKHDRSQLLPKEKYLTWL